MRTLKVTQLNRHLLSVSFHRIHELTIIKSCHMTSRKGHIAPARQYDCKWKRLNSHAGNFKPTPSVNILLFEVCGVTQRPGQLLEYRWSRQHCLSRCGCPWWPWTACDGGCGVRGSSDRSGHTSEWCRGERLWRQTAWWTHRQLGKPSHSCHYCQRSTLGSNKNDTKIAYTHEDHALTVSATHSQMEKAAALPNSPLTLKTVQGLSNWYKYVKLHRGYHQVQFNW